jgi:predicted RNA binding protein YcfA (HicA-like mRNA interferase family)
VKLPRNVNGDRLVQALQRLGYVVVRQSSSHIRMKDARQQPLTVPMHKPLKVGTLAGILDDVVAQTGMAREDVLRSLEL